MPKSQTSSKGDVSELKVLLAYWQAGFAVCVPLGGGTPYDLIVDTGSRLWKVQVKTGRLRKGCIMFPTQRYSGHKGGARNYEPGEIDFFAMYCPELDRIYACPHGNLPTQGFLRYAEPKNKQQLKIRWAKDHEFEMHVRELKEGG